MLHERGRALTTISKKICLLGDFAVGKTSLVRRFVYDLFDDRYLSTVGVKVSRKILAAPEADTGVVRSMMIWDLAGNDGITQVRESYMRGASGAVLVCDLTREDTLENLHQYVDLLLRVSPGARLLVAANKHDLNDQHRLALDQVASFADRLHTEHFVTSAKTGEQVEALFQHMGQLLIW